VLLSLACKAATTNDAARAHRGVKVSNTTSPMRLSMMLGVGLGYMAWPPLPPPPGDGPFGGDGSGDSPSSLTERRFSAGRAGGAARATFQLSQQVLHLESSMVQ